MKNSVIISLSALLLCCHPLIAQSQTPHYQVYLNKQGLAQVGEKFQTQKAWKLVKLWDSLYPERKTLLYNELSAARWESLLLFNINGAVKNREFKLETQLSYPLAIIYHRQTKYTEALPIFKKLLAHRKELGNAKFEEVLARLETAYRATGQFSNAIQIRKMRINYGYSNNFWELYSATGLHKEAIQDFKLFEKYPANDDFEKVRYYNKIGNLYLDNAQPDSAIAYFSKMEKQAQYLIQNKNYNAKNSYSESVKYYYKALAGANIAEVYMLNGQFKKAIPKLDLAIVYCKTIDEVDQKIVKWLDLAQCYLGLNQVLKSKYYLDSAKIAMRNKRMLPSELRLLKLSAVCNQKLGNRDEYINNLEGYLNLKDSVLSINQKNQSVLLLANMDIQEQKLLLADNQKALQTVQQDQEYQKKVIIYTISGILGLIIISGLLYYNARIHEKSKKEIALQNEQLRKNAAKINKQNADNEILLKEIHHRVKNNLQVVYSLLNLQKRRVETEEVKHTLEALQNRIRSMALVHQQLYVDGNLRDILASGYIKTLVLHLKTIFGSDDREVKLIYHIEKITLPLEKAIPLGLIVNEAVSNAFKYAFKEQKGGVLKISLSKKSESYQLVIDDNGMGFTDQDIEASSLGMQLINNMAEQLKAVYTRSSETGTRHQFNFPIQL